MDTVNRRILRTLGILPGLLITMDTGDTVDTGDTGDSVYTMNIVDTV